MAHDVVAVAFTCSLFHMFLLSLKRFLDLPAWMFPVNFHLPTPPCFPRVKPPNQENEEKSSFSVRGTPLPAVCFSPSHRWIGERGAS